MRGIACYYLIYSIVMNLVIDKQYQSYIKSFMGMILVMLIMAPIFRVFRKDLDVAELFKVNEMKQQWNHIQEQVPNEKYQRNEYVLNACKMQMEEQIYDLAETKGLTIKNVEIEMDGENEIVVKELLIIVEDYEETKQIEEFKISLSEVYQLDVSHINVRIR